MRHEILDTHLLTKREAKRAFRDAIFTAWRGRCCYCGTPNASTIDHIRPQSKGGASVKSNMAPACPACNRCKGSEEVFSWFRRQPQWSPDREADLLLWIHQHCFGDSAASLLLASVDGG